MKNQLSRRDFHRLACAGASIPLLGSRVGWSASRKDASKRDVIVVVFQRGAMDGLNAVIPYTENLYYSRRPTIAVPAPGGGAESAIALNDQFALNPSLAPFKALYDAGELAVVHAAGLTTPSRSHFDAQDFMERAWLSQGSVFDGWLNRYVSSLEASTATFRAVGMGTAVSRSLSGAAPVVGLSSIEDFGIESASQRSESLKSLLSQTFDGQSFVDSTGLRAFAAVDELATSPAVNAEVENGAVYPDGAFGQRLRDLAALIKSDLGVEVATVDIGGWDTHNNEVNELNPLLAELSEGLAAFRTDLGATMARVTVVTMTEFGRRAYENGSQGTDHGRGSAMFVLGGGVIGGQVYADWPTLADAALDNGDLAVTTDYRAVLAELLIKRGGVSDLSAIFPGLESSPTSGLFA